MSTWKAAYQVMEDTLTSRGVDIAALKAALKSQWIETPSWGYADSGTRFKVFRQAGAARTTQEKLQDAAQVHKYTGIAPSVAMHIPWDKVDDYAALSAYAASLGLKLGAINPNLFQDNEYMLGSLCNPDASIRRRAVDHCLECIEIAKTVGSKDISLWLADGISSPGQDDFRDRKHRLQDTLKEIYAAMPDPMRILIEYKFFEPAFYATDLGDWASSILQAQKLGPRAMVLVDLGHHPLGTNIEQIVAFLIDEGRLGGFHFNNKKFADDDLTVGSINPYELFLIYNELVAGYMDPAVNMDVAYMIDESVNIKPKVASMIQSVVNVQEAYARALLVDRKTLKQAQLAGDVVKAEETVLDAYRLDVRPLLAQVREEMGLAPDPLAAYEASGYYKKVCAERAGTASGGYGFQGA
ncbi:MAG: L-rhamnose isomerase [Anaerolineae bacterium]